MVDKIDISNLRSHFRDAIINEIRLKKGPNKEKVLTVVIDILYFN
jgi:hypothetical protein